MNISGGVKYRQRASFLLATLGRRAEKEWATILAEHKITTAQFTVMAALAEGQQTQSQVSKAVAVDPRNIGLTVKKLTEVGWVQSRPNPEDGRSHLLSLTSEGQQWWGNLQPELRRRRKKFFYPLSSGELYQLEELLGKLNFAYNS